MSDVEISRKKQTDSNNQKPEGKSVTESLTGTDHHFSRISGITEKPLAI